VKGTQTIDRPRDQGVRRLAERPHLLDEGDRTGWVNVNEGTNHRESHLPFGGRAGSMSGIGRDGGPFSMERLTELKTIVIDLG